MKSELERLVFLLNPWLVDPSQWKIKLEQFLPRIFIERTALKENSEHWKGPNKAHLIIGPRQVGKTTCVWKHLSQTNSRVLFLNCEERLMVDWCSSPTFFLDDIKGMMGQIDVLFFEEAQHLKEAGLFFKGLIDLKINKPIIITGSSSYHLHAKTRESLAGRATRTLITPFTLMELTKKYGTPSEPVWKKTAGDVIGQQERFGSYPEVWVSPNKEELLYDLIESFIIRDASDLFKIKHIGAFRQLCKLISWQVGNLVNYSEWSSVVGVDVNTVRHYVDILSESGIILVVEPFAGGKRAEITSSPNIYFVDIGVRNAFAGQFDPIDERGDMGRLFENWVVAELYKMLPSDVSLKFWRSKSGAEVDLVLLKGKDVYGVEVKCAKLTQKKISKSSRSFIEAYEPRKFFIVNNGIEEEENIGNVPVCYLRPESIIKIITDLSS